MLSFIYFFNFFSQVCDTKQILVSERDGETSLEYSVPLKSFEFRFQRAQQSKKLVVILRLLQVTYTNHGFIKNVQNILKRKKLLA